MKTNRKTSGRKSQAGWHNLALREDQAAFGYYNCFIYNEIKISFQYLN